ncbi:MAG: ribonuclease R [Flavobacteriales bacterium]|nr:ribonuclease R [Flavobacteriales bacterium]
MAGKRKGGGKKKSGGRRGGPDGLGGSGQRLSGASRYLGDVMEIFRKLPGRPLNARQVASTMGIADRDIRDMLHVLMREQAGKGVLVEVGKGRFMLPEKAGGEGGRGDRRRGQGRKEGVRPQHGDLVTGTIQITKYGKGFVSVPGESEDIMVPKGNTGTAFWGDTVEVGWMNRGRRKVPYVARVVKRARELYVVMLQPVKDYAFGIPTDKRLHRDFLIPARFLHDAPTDVKVAVRLEDWASPDDPPIAEVVEVLGAPGVHEAEMHAILLEYGLPYHFPKDVEAEAETIPKGLDPKEIQRRRDMRDVTTFTIDPEDAKDFDDALSVRDLESGHLEVGVHIADVTHYVRPGSRIEEEAAERATSVYLVDRTIPMLPEVLSNNLCSLRPNEDRYAFSAVFELDKDGMVVKEWFGRTVIHSDRRFTYADAQERLDSGQGDLAGEVQRLDRLANKMRARRFKAGGIDFNTEEVRFRLDEDGKPVEVLIKRMLDANRLIEDFMLLANVRVAKWIAGSKGERPPGAVYRVHDSPDPTKLKSLRQFVAQFGYKMPDTEPGQAHRAISQLLKMAEGKDEERIIKQMAIRSMAKAEYSTDNIGHYGLAFEHYTHFTSPIRRYPDMMVHRSLQHYLDGGAALDTAELDGPCAHSSEREKRAAEAERASIKYKQVEFLGTQLGSEFEGVVNGISSKAVYVELNDNKCEGYIDIRDISTDRFSVDPERQCLVGLHTGQEIHMGDPVRIRVVRADVQRRELEFEWLGAG